MAALFISGAPRTTPNEALKAILNLPSLDLAGTERAKSAAIRLRDTGSGKPNFMAMLKWYIDSEDHGSMQIHVYSHTLWEFDSR